MYKAGIHTLGGTLKAFSRPHSRAMNGHLLKNRLIEEEIS